MKLKTILQIILAAVIIGLGYLVFDSIMKPMRFNDEFNARRNACATKLKAIRTLEDQYKLTYGCYTGSFDTLINRLFNEDSLLIKQEIVNHEKAKADDVSIADMEKGEAIRKGYITLQQAYVNPIAQLREQKKLNYTDADGFSHEFTDQELKDIRYIPYPKGVKKEFELKAGALDKGGYSVPVFECKVSLVDLLADLDKQTVANKIAEIERVSTKYAGWKVGDLEQAVTEGNFE